MRVAYFVVCLLLGIAQVSCIRDEALNAEADILTCTVPEDILKRDPIIENNKVVLMVTADADLTHQAPEFTLTPGATISPRSGTERDFTTPQSYTVTSEDGNWKKEYQVTYVVAGISTVYHFENVKDQKSTLLKYVYNIFYENDSEGKWVMDWASGNAGFALTGAGSEDPASFPTSSSEEGMVGKCVKLVTKGTGDFGEKLDMPIAAGNLFMGTFNMGNALTDPLKATKFGVPFEFVPTYLKGYYKYKAGDEYKDEKGNVVKNKKDTWDIYAIFYETDENTKTLDATDRFDHPNLISIARIEEKDRKETDEWTEFYLPFVTKPGKSVDKEKLKAGKYNVAIVFSSSIEGDYFRGAVGSTLYVDEVELIHAAE